MTRLVRGMTAAVAALVVLLNGMARADASLVGDSVTCEGDFTCSPSTATVGAGSEFGLSFLGTQSFSVDVEASSITLTFSEPVANSFGGFVTTFGDLDSSAGDIVGFQLVTGGELVEQTLFASAVSFTAHSVSINLDGSAWAPGETATISLTFANASVPVPATLLLLSSVVAGLATVRTWRRR
jgi:hypothetical protein